MLRPKIFDALKGYSTHMFSKDVVAGVVVGIVALPLAIAFAIASGVTPDRGLYTAIVAGFLISVLGGSRVQIGGPTGAFVIIIYRIVQQHGINGLLVATIMSGIILMALGFAKLGGVIKFIPYSVTVGFTLGIAFLIFTGQVSDFLGLGLRGLPADFFDKMTIVWQHINQCAIVSVLIGLGTIVTIVVCGRISKRIPGALIAIVASAAAVHYFSLPVETIGSRFGAIPHTLPMPAFPTVDWKMIQRLINPAFTIAMLGAIESLLSAVVADGMIGGRHRSNMELVAQGAANIVSPLFGGLPATGAIARTATNVKNGGRTPIAGIVHAFTLLLLMLFFGGLAGKIPLACLAGVLMVVAYHMSEWRSAISIIKTARSSATVLIATFALTVIVDLTVAIEVGLILATLVFIRSMSIHTNVSMIMPETDEGSSDGNFATTQVLQTVIPKGAILYEINGPLFFGAVYKFREALEEIGKPPTVLIVQMEKVPVIDSTGTHLLEETFRAMSAQGTTFVVCCLRPAVKDMFMRAGLLDYLQDQNVCETLACAIARSRAICLPDEK